MGSRRGLELCQACGAPTGRAGRGDDSIYIETSNGGEIGPLCEDCNRELDPEEALAHIKELERGWENYRADLGRLNVQDGHIEELGGALRALMALGGPGYPYGPTLKRKYKAALLRADRAIAGEGARVGERERWIDEVAEVIARDPRCCDVSSSDAAAIAEHIREAFRRNVREAIARYPKRAGRKDKAVSRQDGPGDQCKGGTPIERLP